MKGDRLGAGRRIRYEHGRARVAKEALDDHFSGVLFPRTFATLVRVITESVGASGHATVDLEAWNSQPLVDELPEVIQVREEFFVLRDAVANRPVVVVTYLYIAARKM